MLGGDLSTVPYTYADMAADALAVLDALGFDSATWVGYSMRGSVLRCVQAAAPERVDAIAYLASSPDSGREPGPEDLAVGLRPAPSNRDEAIAWTLDLLRWTMGRHFDLAPGAANAAMLVGDFGRWGIPVAHLAAGIVGTPGVTTVSPDDWRMLVVFGDEDPIAEGGRASPTPTPPPRRSSSRGTATGSPSQDPGRSSPPQSSTSPAVDATRSRSTRV